MPHHCFAMEKQWQTTKTALDIILGLKQMNRHNFPNQNILFDVATSRSDEIIEKVPKSSVNDVVYWSFNSFSLLIADFTVTADVVLKDKRLPFRNGPFTTQ